MPDQLPSRKPDQSPDELIVLRRSDWDELLMELKAIVKEAVNEARQEAGFSQPNKWVNADEAMRRLGIKKSALQLRRNNGDIKWSKMGGKKIMYDIDSINAYIQTNARNTF